MAFALSPPFATAIFILPVNLTSALLAILVSDFAFMVEFEISA